MQSTGHTSTHERSFTLMHGSEMMYVIRALQWIHGRTANIVDWDPLESSPARALGCLLGESPGRRSMSGATERSPVWTSKPSPVSSHIPPISAWVWPVVYVDGQHHTDGELPSPDGPIHAGRQQHRNERDRLSEPEQMSANLNLTSNAPQGGTFAEPRLLCGPTSVPQGDPAQQKRILRL